jgi:hypothetical protein
MGNPALGDQIIAPHRFNVFGNDGLELRNFLDAIAEAIRDGRQTKLNFRNTKMLYPAGTILLYAEIDRMISTSAHAKPITILQPKSQRAREVLKQIGLFDLTGDKCATIPKRNDVVFWSTAKGKDQSGQNLAVIEVVAKTVKLELGTTLLLDSLWRGVSEAVANSVEHAHKLPREADGFQGLAETTWWMFTQVKDDIFYVVVCDLGCGYRATIGQSIPERFIAQLSQAFAGQNVDAIAIETAMEFGRSGTKETHRGRGSRDAMTVLERHQNGELAIFSNSGAVQYQYSGGNSIKQKRVGLGFSINGTILWWKLPLKAPGK